MRTNHAHINSSVNFVLQIRRILPKTYYCPLRPHRLIGSRPGAARIRRPAGTYKDDHENNRIVPTEVRLARPHLIADAIGQCKDSKARVASKLAGWTLNKTTATPTAQPEWMSLPPAE